VERSSPQAEEASLRNGPPGSFGKELRTLGDAFPALAELVGEVRQYVDAERLGRDGHVHLARMSSALRELGEEIAVAKRNPVLICGFGRSGTSAVALAVSKMGVWFGDDGFVESPVACPTGTMELGLAVQINRALLKELGLDVFSPPPPNLRFDGEYLDPYLDAAKKLVSFFGNRRWAMKDGRFAYLLPFWRRVVGDVDVIVLFRNPFDVAESAARLGWWPKETTFRCWASVYEAVLAQEPHHRMLGVSYDALMADVEGQIGRIAAWLGFDGDLSEAIRSIDKRFQRFSR